MNAIWKRRAERLAKVVHWCAWVIGGAALLLALLQLVDGSTFDEASAQTISQILFHAYFFHVLLSAFRPLSEQLRLVVISVVFACGFLVWVASPDDVLGPTLAVSCLAVIHHFMARLLMKFAVWFARWRLKLDAAPDEQGTARH